MRSAEGLTCEHEKQECRLHDAGGQEDRRERGVDELRKDVARPLEAPRSIRPEPKRRAIASRVGDYGPMNDVGMT